MWSEPLSGFSLREQFLAQNRHTSGRFDAETHLIALELDDRDPNIRPDHDLLRLLSAQYQHPNLLAVRLA